MLSQLNIHTIFIYVYIQIYTQNCEKCIINIKQTENKRLIKNIIINVTTVSSLDTGVTILVDTLACNGNELCNSK